MVIRLIVVISTFASAAVAHADAEWLGATVIQTSDQSVARTTLPPPPRESVKTLQELLALAFKNNPTLAAAASRMNAARGRQVQAGLYPNPVVGYHATEVGNQGTLGAQGGFISQRIITAGKLELDQAAAVQAVNASHFQFHAQERRVLTDVKVRYFKTLAAQRRAELTRELEEIAVSLVQATEKLLEGRLKTENDLLQAQIRLDEAAILIDNSRNELDEAWRRLSAVVGVPGLPIERVAGDLSKAPAELEWETSYGTLLAGHPELNVAIARAEQARILICRAKQEPIPDIDLFFSLRHANVTSDEIANIQVGVPIPIFNKNQGNIAAAEAQWIAACKEIERIKLQLQEQLAVTFRRYANAKQQADRYTESILPRAERSLKLVTNGYASGQVEYLTLLIAQQTYVQANLSLINAQEEVQTSSALIEGQLLEGSLARRSSIASE